MTKERWVERRKEEIFERVEIKIDILVEIHHSMTGLPAVGFNDPPQQVELENDLFDGLLGKTRTLFPDLTPSFDRYQTLSEREAALIDESNRIFNIRESRKKRGLLETIDRQLYPIQDEQSALRSSPDLDFMCLLAYGLTAAKNKRGLVRKMFTHRGERYLDPATYYDELINKDLNDALIGLSSRRNRISRVLPGRFSISFVTDDADYWKSLGYDYSYISSETGETVEGTFRGKHYTGIFNLLLGNNNLLAVTYFYDHKLTAEENNVLLENKLRQTHEHEDLHAFLEGYPITDVNIDLASDIDEIKRSLTWLRDNKERFISEGRIPPPNFIRQQKKWERRLANATDNLHEETVVRYILNEPMPKYKMHTLYRNAKEIAEWLEREQVPISTHTISYLADLPVFKQIDKIASLYKKVEAERPEKEKDFKMALFLFPPSQIRYIESLVNRWCTQ